MKLRKLVVDRIRVEHGHFRSSRKRQSQKTGSYTVTTSLACFQWLLRYIVSPPHKHFENETLYQDLIRTKHMVKYLKFNFPSLFIAIASVS